MGDLISTLKYAGKGRGDQGKERAGLPVELSQCLDHPPGTWLKIKQSLPPASALSIHFEWKQLFCAGYSEVLNSM